MVYIVKIWSAAGRCVEVTVAGRNESNACKLAVQAQEEIDPGQGWRADWALPR